MARASRYLCRVRLEGRDRVVLWEAGDDGTDRVLFDEAGTVVTYASEADARSADTAISSEAAPVFDLDAVLAWCRSGDLEVDCSATLDTWNLLADVPLATELFAAADARAEALYDKLFHSCNLPAMGADPGDYVPTWDASEVATLKHLLAVGIADFRSRFVERGAVEQGVATDGASPRR